MLRVTKCSIFTHILSLYFELTLSYPSKLSFTHYHYQMGIFSDEVYLDSFISLTPERYFWFVGTLKEEKLPLVLDVDP